MSGVPKRSANLTPRELEILTLLAQGYSNAEIAETLCVECLTVRSHTNNIYSKMAVANRTQATLKALALGLVRNPYHETVTVWRGG